MDTVLFYSALIVGAVLAWLLLEALFYNVAAEVQYAFGRFAEIRADIRDAPYRRVNARRMHAWAATAASERKREQESSAAEFYMWLKNLFDPENSASAIDRDLLEAMRQTPILRRLVEEQLPQTIKRCVATHRLVGMAEGASYFYEIALRPECFKLRERVIHLNRAAVDMLENYPMLIDDPALIQNLAVIRSKIAPTCRNCPYLRYQVSRAPVLCPSAEIVTPAEEDFHEDGEQTAE